MSSGVLGRCVVAGGGAVGTMMAELLRRHGHDVTVVDARPREPDDVRGDVTAPDSDLTTLLAEADVVVLALPEPVALACLGPVAAELPSGALLVDTLSVKGPFADEATALRPDVEIVGLNPMFAPSLAMRGRPVAEVVVRDGPRRASLSKLLAEEGAAVVPLDAHGHDRLTAATQAMTHAAVLGFGLGLASYGPPATELAATATPPHATLLALLARISGGTTEVYWDIQANNPLAIEARGALTAGLRRVADIVDSGDEQAFAAALAELRGFLGPELGPYTEHCIRMFSV